MERDFYVEAPKHGDFEFFLQHTKADSVAAHAHIHESVELLYCTVGSFTVLVEGEEHPLAEGDLILFPSNALHHIVSGSAEENAYYVIKVKPSLLFDLSASVTQVMRFTVGRAGERCLWKREELSGGAIEAALLGLVREHETRGYAEELAMRLHAASLLLAILRDGTPSAEGKDAVGGDEIAERVYAAILYVRRHFKEDLDAKGLAARMGISYSYFSRSFGRIAGKSFKEYLNHTRVNHAEQLLLTTRKSVTEIAAECGYNNVSYFISVYRKMKGTTPSRTARDEDLSAKPKNVCFCKV